MNTDGMKPRVLTILGAAGTIGVSTLDVVARHPDRFKVFALSGATQVERMVEQIRTHRPRFAVMSEPAAAAVLRDRVAAEGLVVEVLEGATALTEVSTAPEVDTVMAAIVGAAGLPATLAAAQAGKRILLANKETLVVAGAELIGANCGNGIAGMVDIVKEIRKADAEIPVLVHANAGMPHYHDGQTIFPESPDEMAALVPEIIAAGANIVGGCCGTTPGHICRVREAVDKN